MKRRQALHSMGALALLLQSPQIARGASIVAVRVWPAPDYTRVTIESDVALQARHFLLDAGPPRLVLDIDDLELDPALRELIGKIRPDDPYIAGVRVGQYQPRTVRLVADLKRAVVPQHFALAPIAPYRHRLVLDLYPAEQADPLLVLLRERQPADSAGDTEAGRAAREVQDALGELIDKVGRETPPAPAASASASPAAPASAASGTVATAPPPVAQAQPAPLPVPPAPPRRAAPATAAEKQRAKALVIVALDPGHGGEDPGAIGPSGLREKDVVLAIALALKDKLDAVPGVKAMLTRDADFFVPLHERVRKARGVQADLFVSIHADAFLRPEARGASVFVLSDRGATSSAARWMAERENASDKIGGVNVASTNDRDVLRAILDMSTTAQIKDSLRLGHEVLSRIGEVGELHKGEVEQAGFAVLKAPDIPSILVETAFISNPQEEKQLRSARYRARLVEALAAGITRYFAKNPPLARQRLL